jgi:RimJ/RimL family protein N-acetyltransferase
MDGSRFRDGDRCSSRAALGHDDHGAPTDAGEAPHTRARTPRGPFPSTPTAVDRDTCGVEGPARIRRSTGTDFAAWLAVYEAVAAEGRWIGAEAPVDRERARRSFDEELDSDTGATFLAELDGQVVGILGVSVCFGLADLGMMVLEGHRGQGIGRALLEACIDWARGAGAHKVILQVWPHNAPAIALYERLGFQHEGRRVRHFRRRNGELWDALEMGLVLEG